MSLKGFALALIFVGMIAMGARASSVATVSGFDITPKSGGAGTIVHVTGFELYYTEPLAIELGIAVVGNGPNGVIEFHPIAVLGYARPNMTGADITHGSLDATVVIPGRMPDGHPITEHLLAVRLLDSHGKPLPELAPRPFDFAPNSLPPTGTPMSWQWLLGASVLIFAFGLVALEITRWRR